MNLAGFPQELKERRQWIVWKLEPDKDGKLTKVPYNPKSPGFKASSTKPASWGTLAQAIAAARSGFSGIGFVFSQDDPCTGIDLDKCRNPETGEIAPGARAVIERLASYTEISPSGCGVHIIIKGKVPAGGNKKGRLEMYSRDRYFTMTGAHLEGTPTTIEPRQAELEALHREIFGAHRPEPKLQAAGNLPALDLPDAEIITRARNAANGEKFSSLWEGNLSCYPSPSEATAALLSMLAFWCGPDPARIDRLFRQSGLMRPKWDRKQNGETWGALEIAKAIRRTTEFYGSGRAA
jgi:putative DNA primase/helicase